MAALPDIAVILTDKERRILWVNEDFTTITGYTLGEVLGKKPSLLQGPKTEPDAVRRIRKQLDNHVSLKEQLINYRKNGEAYVCKLVIHPIFDSRQNLTNFIAFEVDGNLVQDDSDIPLLQISEKYSTSSLKGVEEIRLFFRVRELVQEEKLYLNPNLTLRLVADRLGTNTKYLSQVVNHQSGHNFQQFINTFRVAEFKQKMIEAGSENLTLHGIAMQCGFKNKSTFYKVFKEITGLTPREFLLNGGGHNGAVHVAKG